MCNFNEGAADLHRTGWVGGWERGGKEKAEKRGAKVSAAVPAEIQKGACGGGDALSRPAEEVELGERAGLLRLHVFQVEAAHQEVVAPDVL